MVDQDYFSGIHGEGCRHVMKNLLHDFGAKWAKEEKNHRDGGGRKFYRIHTVGLDLAGVLGIALIDEDIDRGYTMKILCKLDTGDFFKPIVGGKQQNPAFSRSEIYEFEFPEINGELLHDVGKDFDRHGLISIAFFNIGAINSEFMKGNKHGSICAIFPVKSAIKGVINPS